MTQEGAGPAVLTGEVTLREITEKTLRPILDLKVGEGQDRFVASNAVSIAQAHFAEDAWFRGVYAGDTPVGFVMLSVQPEKPLFYLWRLMIDQRYQRAGIGQRVIDLVVEHVRGYPEAKVLFVSCVPGEGTPQPFYERLDFRANGDIEDGEVVLERVLRES